MIDPLKPVEGLAVLVKQTRKVDPKTGLVISIKHGFDERPGRGAKQQFKDECDINFIMRKVKARQIHLQDLIRADGKYGDYSSAHDFREAQDIIAHAKEQFEALPAKTRARFANDPAQLLAFVADAENKDEARRLGLLRPEAPDTVPAEEPRVETPVSKKNSKSAKADLSNQPKAEPKGDSDVE